MTTDHAGLTFRILDPSDADPELIEGWGQAMRRGFHQGRWPAESHQRWLQHARADRATLRGVWQDRAPVGSGAIPVATFSSWDQSIDVGGDRILPVHMISDVTVSPTHRRRGLTRSLMTVDLADAVAAGLPLAALTVSEGAIYGRFGFGAATFVRHIEVDVTARFRLRDDVPGDDGSMTLVEPGDAWKAVAQVFADFHARTRGSVERPSFYEPWLGGSWDFESHAPDARLRTAVHLTAAGEPDGYVIYQAEQGRDLRRTSVTVVDLVATNPAAYLRLWDYLAGLDLVHQICWRKAPLDDPLPWALVEPFVVRTTKVGDFLWLRVLDVKAALEARPWGADGQTVIEVDDPLGHTAGRWRVVVEGGRAEVTRTDAEAAVSLAAETLGSLYLGGVAAATLVEAGRLRGDTTALADWAAMCDTGPAPYCITGF